METEPTRPTALKPTITPATATKCIQKWESRLEKAEMALAKTPQHDAYYHWKHDIKIFKEIIKDLKRLM